MTSYRLTPNVLVCSGLDPSGGAGFIADVRVIDKLGGRPAGVVTALTVQNTTGVAELQPCDPELVDHQLGFLLTDIQFRAVKIGLLGSAAIARSLGTALQLTDAPVVWDPILAATRGNIALLDDVEGALAALRPHLTLITPNRHELAQLAGRPMADLAAAATAATELAHRADCAVLVKGGHFDGDESIDLLVHGDERHELRGPRVAGEDVHGTGCALSSAIATHLARGRTLVEACRLAKEHVAALIVHHARPGRGATAVV